MSNHFSAAMLKFPGGDARLDLTDLFVFASPENPGKTVVILDVNPFRPSSLPTLFLRGTGLGGAIKG